MPQLKQIDTQGHSPPHFHVTYAEYEELIEIKSLRLV
ncbi:DUF4160 domain-containing protein [Marinilabilia salmonicolor]